MSGSVFFAVIVAVVGIVCAIFITPILLIPAVLVIAIGLFAGGVFGAGDAATPGSAAGQQPSGVPTTADATYDPVQQPGDTQQVV